MKTEELIENYLVYTDNGIEKVHWCNVNGVKELVFPKGKVYGYVPDYFEFKRLQEQLKEANEVIKYYGMGVVTRTAYWAGQPYMRPEETTSFPEKALEYLKKWGVK